MTRKPKRGKAEPKPRRDPPPAVVADFPVVAVGASAGGLDAFRKLFDAMPSDIGMAFVLVQHLDPTHQSMMVELLAGHTAMTVRQAAEGMRVERDSVYVAPPGVYLEFRDGTIHLARPREGHAVRMPFDFMLRSLAKEFGVRAICIILSGTGTDGSIGLRAVNEALGLVMVQKPDDAEYDGMPKSALATGAADLVCPVTDMPSALARYLQQKTLLDGREGSASKGPDGDMFRDILDLLRTKTGHDFSSYKEGTLRRRIERRMAMTTTPVEPDGMVRYLELLRGDRREVEMLAQDLLIKVTHFFRDPAVFDFLAREVVPALVRDKGMDPPLRIWVVGCSTGEEAYSLAMLIHEIIAAAKLDSRLLVFASDIDPNAVASAREGIYPESIEADVSPARLRRFFVKDGHVYKVKRELREQIVFTVHDVLVDPPFLNLDAISCRNVLIYLQPEAQEKVYSIFHFSLREGGILLLGTSEAVAENNGDFEAISGADRVFRHIGRGRPRGPDATTGQRGVMRNPVKPAPGAADSRHISHAELCRQMVLDTYALTALLIDGDSNVLYALGGVSRYLDLAAGDPAPNAVVSAHEDVRTELETAIRQARRRGTARTSRIVVQQAPGDRDLLLVHFMDDSREESRSYRPAEPHEVSRVDELEHELDATKSELRYALHDLDLFSEEQRTVNEEALSVKEEFQATNEELLASKEELQSLNEELSAVNDQLRETVEQLRRTADDMQNILTSTRVATLFLDPDLNIRFFTPSTRSFFNVIPSDVGRPLLDLGGPGVDDTLPDDLEAVQRTGDLVEREMEFRDDSWFLRRVMPYRTQDDEIEGVVITFSDVTVQKIATREIGTAKERAEAANVAKSRFLATASHDLRQPLQTISLLQGLLGRSVKSPKAQDLIDRLKGTVFTMSSMLNALLDINRIEAGTVRPDVIAFPIDQLLERLSVEFGYQARESGIALRVVSCGQFVRSDPRLLEQVIRNLLINALKYTERGDVLLGCRRRGNKLSIEVWDTGPGIPDSELSSIFTEFHQLDTQSRDGRRGFGLGLSIVRLLADLLGHEVGVYSRLGRGSTFTVQVDLAPAAAVSEGADHIHVLDRRPEPDGDQHGAILVVEDDPEVRELLEILLGEDGYSVTSTADGVAALELLAQGARFDLVVADYNLPKGVNGVQVGMGARDELGKHIPLIILTGDISSGTLRDIWAQGFVQVNKPVNADRLLHTIRECLSESRRAEPHRAEPVTGESSAHAPGDPDGQIVYIIEDEEEVRENMADLLAADGRSVETYSSCESFLESVSPVNDTVLLLDAYLPGMSGLDMLRRLKDTGVRAWTIMLTGRGDVPLAVEAMKAGAFDFIEKPVSPGSLIAVVERALDLSRNAHARQAWKDDVASRLMTLTPRQREVMQMVLAGHPSKNIAADLGISQRTVENHRAAIMRKMGTRSIPALAQLAFAADDPAGASQEG